MNLRVSLILLIVGSWVAVAAVFVIDSDVGSEGRESEPPFFYNIPVNDLVGIELETQGETVGFHYRPDSNRWYFDQTDEYIEVPTNDFRWGGITTLLSGPRTQRFLSESIDNPATYGFDDPQSRYTFTLRDGSVRTILIGDATVDGEATYAKIDDREQLVLVDASWAGVLDRLVTDPPTPEWMFTLDTDEIREVLLFVDSEVVRAYGIDRPTGEYHLCTLPIDGDPCKGDTPVDLDAFTAEMENIANRKVEGAVAIGLTDEPDYAPYGADRNSPYIAIRVERPAPNGVTEVDRVTISIGDVTPDGEGRFAVANETSDIIRVDREWADRILELFFGDPLIADA